MDKKELTKSGALEVQDFIIKEMRTGFTNVHTRIDRYHQITAQNTAKLDHHILACDKRDAERRQEYYADKRAIDNGTALEPRSERFSKSWVKYLTKRLIAKVIDYAVFVVILLIVFSIKHWGSLLPMPTN
jgi:hypothetical protein